MNENSGQPRNTEYHVAILVIDDDPNTLRFCQEVLKEVFPLVETARGGTEALERLSESPFDIVITDLQMPNMDGFALIENVRSRWAKMGIVAMTSFPGEEILDRLLQLGVSSLLVKPFSPQQLSYTAMGASKMLALQRENETLRVTVEEMPFGIAGDSPEIREVISKIRQVGPLDVPALIEGESGTGKELVARGIHVCSRRSKGAFVAVNCAAVSPSLIESELFGHAKGAFTGATSEKIGLIEAADKGTLFLDEIGEMPLDLQPKLLRVLDTGEVLRVGDTKPRYAGVRVIAATNRSLQERVKSHKFREDLFFRVRGLRVTLPPLRQCGADVLVLAEHFLKKYCPPGREPLKLLPDVRAALLDYSWPGNVRELQNLAAAVYAAQSKDFVTADDIAGLLDIDQETGHDETFPPYKNFKAAELAKTETQYFTRLLAAFRGNVAKASEAAQMYPANLRAKLRRYGIDLSEFRRRDN